MEEMLILVGNLCFPIVVTAFLLMRIEKKLNMLSTSITELTKAIAVLKCKGKEIGKEIEKEIRKVIVKEQGKEKEIGKGMGKLLVMEKKLIDWQKIVIHHSASPTEIHRSGKMVTVDASIIREWQQTEGWNDIGYHFVILPDGKCENGRPLDQPGAHCHVGQRNSIGIGVCLVGNFSETEVPDAQLRGLIDKVAQLLIDYDLGVEDVELHRDVPRVATECPGRYFPADVLKIELEKSLCG